MTLTLRKEIQVFRCKCGGAPNVQRWPAAPDDKYWVCCDGKECPLETHLHSTPIAAAQAWNRLQKWGDGSAVNPETAVTH